MLTYREEWNGEKSNRLRVASCGLIELIEFIGLIELLGLLGLTQ